MKTKVVGIVLLVLLVVADIYWILSKSLTLKYNISDDAAVLFCYQLIDEALLLLSGHLVAILVLVILTVSSKKVSK